MANASRGSGGAEHVHSPRVRGNAGRQLLKLVGSRSTQQSVGLHSGAVKVSVLLVNVTQKRVDRPVSTVPNSVDVDVNGVLQLDRQAQLGSGLFLREEVVTGVDCGAFMVGGPASAFMSGVDGCVDFAGDVAVGVASPAVLAGGVTIRVASPAVAGVASLANLAGGVNIGVASPAFAGVASPTIAGVASTAVARVASLADLAGSVTIGVASLADAGAASLVDAGVASLAGMRQRRGWQCCLQSDVLG